MRHTIVVGFLAAAITLATVQSSVAQDMRMPTSPGVAPVVPRDPVKTEMDKVAQAADTVRISLVEAVRIAQQSTAGKPIEATLLQEKKPPAYKVTIVDDKGKLHIIQVDGLDGKIVK